MQLYKRAALSAAFLGTLSGGAFAQGQVSGNAFNPAISLILDGHFASYSRDPETYRLPGFELGDEAGPAAEGLSLDETELAISANVDDKYYGAVTASLHQDAGGDAAVEVEEAYFETLALPKSLKVKAGRFLSDIGYLNPIHAHAWDFSDAPLAYVAMLNTTYKDDGVQLRWVVPSNLLIEIGGELMRGDSFPGANGAASSGTGASTFFVHVGGDVGTSSWRAGLSHLAADANDRSSVFVDGSMAFTGSSDLTIADFVWKWAKNGNPRDRSLTLQGEYLRRREDGAAAVTTLAAGDESGAYVGTQNGFYVQAVYQFYPRWRVGGRFDRLDASNAVAGVTAATPLLADHDPSRVSAMVDFSNSEFSRLRLQWNRDDSRPQTDQQLIFQYLMSLGAHGAHRF